MKEKESAEKGTCRDIARDIVRIMANREGAEAPVSQEASLEALSVDPGDLIKEAEDILNGIDLNVGEENLPQTVKDFEEIIISHFSEEFKQESADVDLVAVAPSSAS